MRIAIFALVCACLGILMGVALARARLGDAAAVVLPDAGETGRASLSNISVPQVSVDQETYDFGQMERNSSQSHDFLFTNVGDAPLELTVGDTTCQCTIGKVSNNLVEPGQTVPVTLSWTAKTDEPNFRQSAEIHTNDPMKRHIRLTVMGEVSDASSYFPRQLHFGNVPLGKSETAEVKVVSKLDDQFEITGTEFVSPASEEHFQVDVDVLPEEEYPSPAVKSGYRVTVTTGPNLPYGQISGWLKIKTNLKRVREMDVPLAGKVVSDFSIYGPKYDETKDLLDLGQVTRTEGAERRLFVFLRGERGKAVELTIGDTYPAYLHAELGERKVVDDDLEQIPLIVRVPPGSPQAVHLPGADGDPGRIVLQTNHPNVPELTIQVRFTVE